MSSCLSGKKILQFMNHFSGETDPSNGREAIKIWIVISLLCSFACSIIGSFFPAQSQTQTTFFTFDALFAISAFACLGSKATSDNSDVAAAGFNVLAISQGLFLAEIVKPLHWDYESAVTAILFMIPALTMISTYKIFPKWLRIAGAFTPAPFIIFLLIRRIMNLEHTFVIENIIYIVYQAVTLCWAWQIWKSNDKL